VVDPVTHPSEHQDTAHDIARGGAGEVSRDPVRFGVALSQLPPDHPLMVAAALAVETAAARHQGRLDHAELRHDLSRAADWARVAAGHVTHTDMQAYRAVPGCPPGLAPAEPPASVSAPSAVKKEDTTMTNHHDHEHPDREHSADERPAEDVDQADTGPAEETGPTEAPTPVPSSLASLLETWQSWSTSNTFGRAEARVRAAGNKERAEQLRDIAAQGPQVAAVDALAAQHEVASLLGGWEWHTVRAAREQGASWGQIGRATRTDPEIARTAYLAKVDRQESVLAGIEGMSFDEAAEYRAAAGHWPAELHPDTPTSVVEHIETALDVGDEQVLDELRARWWNPDHTPDPAAARQRDEGPTPGYREQPQQQQQQAAEPEPGPAMPGWMAEKAARSEAEWAAADGRPPDGARGGQYPELAARVAALREQIATRDAESTSTTHQPADAFGASEAGDDAGTDAGWSR